jgi:transposase
LQAASNLDTEQLLWPGALGVELNSARNMPARRKVERAKVLLGYADGTSITQLQRRLGFSRPMIYRCVDKALAAGVQMGLKDKYHRPHDAEITDEVKA